MIPYTDLFATLNPHIFRSPHSGPRPRQIHSAQRNGPHILVREEKTRQNIARFGFSDAMYAPHTLWFPTQVVEQRKPGVVIYSGKVVNLNYRWSTEYYHFLTEVLPNALFLRTQLPAEVPIYCMTSKFTVPAFRWFGVTNPIISSSAPAAALQLVPPYVECGNPSAQKIQLLRSVVESKVQFESTHGIVIRRHGSRELLNEAEVLEYCKERFPELTWVVYDVLPIDETAVLFSKAARIVGPHGAGMTNMLFSPKGVQILEFMPITDTNICYWHLAEMLGHAYSMLPLDCDGNGSMRVDLEELSRLQGSATSQHVHCPPDQNEEDI
jgi:capsular polysaccharide biosynthesis protein